MDTSKRIQNDKFGKIRKTKLEQVNIKMMAKDLSFQKAADQKCLRDELYNAQLIAWG